MRGLKHAGRAGGSRSRGRGRAVCPANEGIETECVGYDVIDGEYRRAVCPANEGIETQLN